MSVPEKNIGDANYFCMLKEKLNYFRMRGEFCDVKVEVGDKIFTCNRIILASNSDIFKKLFNEAEKEEIICIENVDPVIFDKLISAFYGCPFNIGEHIISLYSTCVNLQLTYFIEKCREFIKDNLETINHVDLITVPELIEDDILYELIKKSICKKFFSFDFEELCKIPLHIFKDIITDPNLVIFDKDQFLDFVKAWVGYDLKNRWKDLSKIACLLKPFHVPPESANQFVLAMGNQSGLLNEFKLNVALNTLIDSKITAVEPVDEANDTITEQFDVLFLMKSHDDSEISFTTFEDESFVFLDELKCSLKMPISESTEGTVCNNTLFLSTEGKDGSTMFGCCNLENRKWTRISPPPELPYTLITCNSRCLSYQLSPSEDDFQIRAYEPSLNRWLTLPAVKYPREYSGIATDGKLVFLVGGIPLKKINSDSPLNIIEFYDERSKHWSRIVAPNEFSINNDDYSKKVTINNQKLFVFDENLGVFDLRMNSWMECNEESLSDESIYVTSEKHSIWYIPSGTGTDSVIRVFDVNGALYNAVSKPSSFLKPIFVPVE